MLRPLLWMAAAILAFMAMTLAARALASALDPWMVLFLRSAVGLAIVAALLPGAGWRQLRTAQPGRHLWRNGVHLLGQYGWIHGLALIPMAQVVAIEFTVPIWTALLASLLLGERFTRARLAALALGFSGILLVLRPGAGEINPAALAVVGAAVAFALTHILTKRLAERDSPLSILLYMNLTQLLLGAIPAALHWQLPAAGQWPWVIALGSSALLGHYCLTRALSLADASVVLPLDFMRLPLIGLMGYLLYGETLGVWVLLGAALMVAGNYLNVQAERRARAPSADAAQH